MVRTRKPLTPEQKQARIDALARGRATRAANLAAKKNSVVEDDNPVPLDEEGNDLELQVEVNVPQQPIQKLSLKDRLFGTGKQPIGNKAKPATKGRPAKKQENDLIAKVLPTIIAGFIATYAYDKLPEPYKVCAPSKAEVNSMLGPIMAIIARRVEVTGKASQDVIDIANALICSFAYSTRAYITYISIKRSEENSHAAQSKPSSGNEQGHQPGAYQTTSPSVSGPSTTGNDAGRGPDATISHHVDVPDGDYDALDDASRESALIANMFARDKRGRAQLGLLPTAV